MREWTHISGCRGVTLVELIVVLSVISVLAFALSFSFEGWIGRYRAESSIKELHVDLMNARVRAMQSQRMYFVNTDGGKRYTIYEDTNPAPDGDGALDGSDAVWVQKDAGYSVLNTVALPFSFNRDGLIDNSGALRLETEDYVDADYDCVEVSPTRVNLGKWNETDARCDTK